MRDCNPSGCKIRGVRLTSKRPMLSSSHSTLCFNPAIVASASLLVPPASVSSPVTVLGATPHSSAAKLRCDCGGAIDGAVVDGVGRGVPGELCVWKEGGGESGIDGGVNCVWC